LADVFISFIHEEERSATQVSLFLPKALPRSVSVFQSSDRSAIDAGEEWMKKIFNELKSAKVLVSMLSPESVVRPWRCRTGDAGQAK
jgi:hypothetical protein